MKVLLVSVALSAALCVAAPAEKSTPADKSAAPAAPAPPKGWTPSGRLFLVPARPVETPQEPEESKPRVLDSGEYYVLLENGRLQMVKYTATALDDKPADQSADKPADKSAIKPADKSSQQVAGPFARFQVEYLQFPRPVQAPAEKKQDQEASKGQEASKYQESGFETNLQYRDVKPISAPVYAPNPAPLVRILKK